MAAKTTLPQQRMYVFERAWKDFWGKLTGFVSGLKDLCLSIARFLFKPSITISIALIWLVLVAGLGFWGPPFPGMWFWSLLNVPQYSVSSATLTFIKYYFYATLLILCVEAIWKSIKDKLPAGRVVVAIIAAAAGAFFLTGTNNPQAVMRAFALLIALYIGFALISAFIGSNSVSGLLSLTALVWVLYDSARNDFNAMLVILSLFIGQTVIYLDNESDDGSSKSRINMVVSTQAVCAALSVLSVVLVGTLAIVAGTAIFSVYFAVLLVAVVVILAPLTFLRFSKYIWLLWRRITYKCPTTGCDEHGLPIHRCPDCQTEYDNLWPSFYGLFHHRCDHTDGSHTKLPTFDFLGRSSLPRICCNPDCKTPLDGDIGKLPEKLILVAGGTSVGKTVYMFSSIRELLEGRHVNGKYVNASINSPDQEALIEREMSLLETGQLPKKTDVDKDALLLRTNLGKRKNMLYLYDKPGETFKSIDLFGGCREVERLHGLVLLIDPFSLDGLRKEIYRLDDGVRPSDMSLDKVADTISSIQRFQDARDIPVSVVITKADVDLIKQEVGDLGNGGIDSNRCREALIDWGAQNVIRNLETRFDKEKIRFFACSSLGRTPDSTSVPFKPQGVLEPLIWCVDNSK